jgi:hypothetical protein
MKVYVITKGEYSDYHICAVATDPEKADALAKFCSDKYDSAEVEEYDTEDVPDLTKGMNLFLVRFSPSGDVVDIRDASPEVWKDGEIREFVAKPGSVYVAVQANMEEDAIKIGAERRAKYLAQKMGL